MVGGGRREAGAGEGEGMEWDRKGEGMSMTDVGGWREWRRRVGNGV